MFCYYSCINHAIVQFTHWGDTRYGAYPGRDAHFSTCFNTNHFIDHTTYTPQWDDSCWGLATTPIVQGGKSLKRIRAPQSQSHFTWQSDPYLIRPVSQPHLCPSQRRTSLLCTSPVPLERWNGLWLPFFHRNGSR